MGLLSPRPKAAFLASTPTPTPGPPGLRATRAPDPLPPLTGPRDSYSPNHSAFQHHLATFHSPGQGLLDRQTTTPPIGPALFANHRHRFCQLVPPTSSALHSGSCRRSQNKRTCGGDGTEVIQKRRVPSSPCRPFKFSGVLS